VVGKAEVTEAMAPIAGSTTNVGVDDLEAQTAAPPLRRFSQFSLIGRRFVSITKFVILYILRLVIP
jgi:hypothetical protein